jgi:hypothetical protein
MRDKFDPLKSGVCLGAVGWWAMHPSFTTPFKPRDCFTRLEAAGVDATSRPTNVSTVLRLQRLRRRLGRFWRHQAQIEIAQAFP